MYPGLQTRNPDKEKNFLSEKGVPDSLMARIDAAAADTAGTHIRTGYAQGNQKLPYVSSSVAVPGKHFQCSCQDLFFCIFRHKAFSTEQL